MWIRPKDQRIVGRVLAEARLRVGLTQSQLAKRLRKPQSFVSSYEAGQRRVDLLEFITIARSMEADDLALFKRVREAAGR